MTYRKTTSTFSETRDGWKQARIAEIHRLSRKGTSRDELKKRFGVELVRQVFGKG